MGKYEQPLLISYGWACPYHGGHQKQVVLASKPSANKVISLNQCATQFPDDPVLTTKLYGNLKLEVNALGNQRRV